ncbi:MAG TPA: hypothetical protein VMQ83_07440 [Gammaproteobacteria bacterium]|nr:hypothetical protein [Gammaproteobacteria bacterium]
MNADVSVGAAVRGFAFACCLVPAAALAGEPGFVGVVLYDNAAEGVARDVFAPDTAKIVLEADLQDVPTGARLSGVWIATSTQVAPPDYEIDRTTLQAGLLSNHVKFALNRPDAGWPSGQYRVELWIDDRLVETVPFTIAK